MEIDHKKNHGALHQATYSVLIDRIISGQPLEEKVDRVVIEQPITVMIDKVGSFTIMATPLDIEALAVGFVYSEGMIESMDDILEISIKSNLPNVVGIQVHDPSRIAIQRNMIVASSCGMCGTRNIDKMLSEMPPCGQSLAVDSHLLIDAAEHLKTVQEIFQITGGAHAAGLFSVSGQIVSFAEDIGRHSAFDKAIGKRLMAKETAKGCFAVLSGRISLEMVSKAAKAGIELIAAVSAPSSFAIEAARKWNITLCGFVRPGRMNVYTGGKRIKEVQKNV